MITVAKTLISLSLLGSLLSANSFHTDFDEEFNKMQGFMDAIMSSKLKTKYFQMDYPRVDMQETKSSFVVTFNIAGMDKKDIKLTLNDNHILTLEGEKKTKYKEEESSFIKQEIFYGKFQRSIKLPQNINPSTLKTKYQDGILEVSINKKILDITNVKVIPIN